ncbi:MAG: hypothetical protein NTY67_03150 [Cyanobacteria bacterium]|jgi:TolA-binding protein|nr:hypothetical protein [Cyanobacteriota bacterium]
MASSHQRNGARDQDGQPPWLAWLQLSISSMLVVLFVVMLGKVRQQAGTIGELEQKVSTIENARSLDRTTAMEQQLEAMIQRLQSVEQLGEQLRNVDRQQQAIKQDLQQLRSTARVPITDPGLQSSPTPAPQPLSPGRLSSPPTSPRSSTPLQPPAGNF